VYTISVETGFKASHQLTFPDGTQEPLHEHDWRVTAFVRGEQLNSMGLVMDFHILKGLLNEVIGEFVDTVLEEGPVFARNNSSAENVAKYVYEAVEGRLPAGVRLAKVKVVEEPGCAARFSK
jgi:6-pyruvoyltetrahydropterin/6-carboxytetrahydropterin synthase